MRFFVWAMVLAVFSAFSAELYPQVRPEHRDPLVRLTPAGQVSGKITGRLIENTPELLVLSSSGNPVRIQKKTIRRVELAVGKKRNTGKGALIGAVSGGLALGLLSAADASQHQGEWFVPSPEVAFASGFLGGGVLGAGIGALIGRGSYSPRWVEIPLDSLESSRLAPVEPQGESAAPTTAKTGEPLRRSLQLPAGKKVRTTPYRPFRRVHISFIVGNSLGGPGRDIESAFTRYHLSDTSPAGWFSESKEHPYSQSGFGDNGIPWNFSLSYRFKRLWEAGFLLSKTIFGKTSGYREAAAPQWEAIDLDIEYEVTTVASLLYLYPGSAIKMGVGPAWFNATSKNKSDYVLAQNYTDQKLGLILDLRLSLPSKTAFFVEFAAQYRFIPAADIGPYSVKDSQEMMVPEFKINYSHLFIGLGIGLRSSP